MTNELYCKTTFEDLPDEIILLICRYLTQLNILDSFSNLNKRFNQSITFYRENIYLSHLTYNEFQHFIHYHLPRLASNVTTLFINNSSMINTGKIFENIFDKIDQQFPRLIRLDFYQIDIETLENLSWRFNTMNCLRQLNIHITKDRLSSMPIGFDQFLCGKLFSSSNLFEYLTINFSEYQFNLRSFTHKCEHLRYLTISVKHLNDLLILFDYLPNLVQLNITIGCSLPLNNQNETYHYDHLWWKVHFLTKFSLTIEEKNLTSHDYVISHEILFQIIENLYFLSDIKFELDIKFTSALQITTTKDIYTEKYLPYLNGTLWEQALKRNDHRMIHFQLYVQLDGIADNQSKRMKHSDQILYNRTDYFNLQPLLKSTFSSAYWLQKNLIINCFNSSSTDIAIYTDRIRKISRTITIDNIDQELSINRIFSHRNIQDLSIISNSNSSIHLCLKNLIEKYPYLISLRIDSSLIHPPIGMICSNHLRSISLFNYSLILSCQLLEYLPNVISLSIRCSTCEYLQIHSTIKSSSKTITRLKLIIHSYHMTSFENLKTCFPYLKEFYLIIKNISSGSLDAYRQCAEFEQLSNCFNQLRYMEINLPIKQGFLLITTRDHSSEFSRISRMKTLDGHCLILKYWL